MVAPKKVKEVRGSLHELPTNDEVVFELAGSPALDEKEMRNKRRRARVYQHAAWSR